MQGTLADMSRSGVLQVRATGREKYYWLKQDSWKQVLSRGESAALKWVNWPPLFSALEQIWLRLDSANYNSLVMPIKNTCEPVK